MENIRGLGSVNADLDRPSCNASVKTPRVGRVARAMRLTDPFMHGIISVSHSSRSQRAPCDREHVRVLP